MPDKGSAAAGELASVPAGARHPISARPPALSGAVLILVMAWSRHPEINGRSLPSLQAAPLEADVDQILDVQTLTFGVS